MRMFIKKKAAAVVGAESSHRLHVVPTEDQLFKTPTVVVSRHQRDEALEDVIVRNPTEKEFVSLE
jgi:hypothetical protein